MDQPIDLLTNGILIALCAATLVVLGLVLYLLILCHQLHRELRRYLRRPQVERDGLGRKLRERL